jgi:hypothetical protein
MSLASEYLESLHERFYSDDDIYDNYLSAKGYDDIHEDWDEEDYEIFEDEDEYLDEEYEESERAGDLIAELCAYSEEAYDAFNEEMEEFIADELSEAKKKGGRKRKGFKPAVPYKALDHGQPNKFRDMQRFKRVGLLNLGDKGIMGADPAKLIERANKIGFNAVIRGLLNLHIMTRNQPKSKINKKVNALYAKVKAHFDKARKAYDKLPLAQRKKKRRPGVPTKAGKDYLNKRRAQKTLTKVGRAKDTVRGKGKKMKKDAGRATIPKGTRLKNMPQPSDVQMFKAKG